MYILQDNSAGFIINFKVCYTTFEMLIDKNIVYRSNNIDENILLYLIVRNPIDRFISFYKDKIMNQIHKLGHFNQDCHKAFLKFYDEEFIRSKEFNIDCVLYALENGYHDAHLNNQSSLYNYFYNKKTNKNIFFIKLDDIDFNDKILKLLKIDHLPKCNNTDSIGKIELSKDQIKRIIKIYKDDFIIFNYLEDIIYNKYLVNKEFILNDNEPILHDNEPILHDNEPILHDNEPILNDNEPILHDNEPILNDNEPILHDKEPILHDNEPILHDNEPILHDNEPILHDNEPILHDKEPILNNESAK